MKNINVGHLLDLNTSCARVLNQIYISMLHDVSSVLLRMKTREDYSCCGKIYLMTLLCKHYNSDAV